MRLRRGRAREGQSTHSCDAHEKKVRRRRTTDMQGGQGERMAWLGRLHLEKERDFEEERRESKRVREREIYRRKTTVKALN